MSEKTETACSCGHTADQHTFAGDESICDLCECEHFDGERFGKTETAVNWNCIGCGNSSDEQIDGLCPECQKDAPMGALKRLSISANDVTYTCFKCSYLDGKVYQYCEDCLAVIKTPCPVIVDEKTLANCLLAAWQYMRNPKNRDAETVTRFLYCKNILKEQRKFNKNRIADLENQIRELKAESKWKFIERDGLPGLYGNYLFTDDGVDFTIEVLYDDESWGDLDKDYIAWMRIEFDFQHLPQAAGKEK